jgi:hypothetical protein
MTVKYFRQNTNFQIAYFIAGSCHTPDAAYFALKNAHYERSQAVAVIPASELRLKAKRIEIERQLASDDEVEQLKGQADLLQYEIDKDNFDKLTASAKSEVEFIEECIRRIQPLRKYGHLDDIEAAEACQAEEWLFELERRAENYLLTTGTIPHDHFNTMRQHPNFKTHLLPHINNIHTAIANNQAPLVLSNKTPRYDLPKLMGLPSPNIDIEPPALAA